MKYLALAAALVLPAAASLADEATTRLHVTGLTCPSCSYIVATALKRIETVEIAEFVEGTNEDGIYVLRFDDEVTAPEAIVDAVLDVGYGAELAPEPES